jgi:sugar lactone lactonase YvrE
MSRLIAVRPVWAIQGGRVSLEGDGLPVDPDVPMVRVGGVPARLAKASTTALTVIVPEGLEGGQTAIRIDQLPGETAYIDVGTPLATGLHQVDSPAYDRHGNLFVTFSGSRGQQAPVTIFVVRPDGTREPFVSDVPNPTSLAFSPDGELFVSSRFDGSVYRVTADGRATLHATELGIACGIAFSPDGALYVGDRSGSILRVDHQGRTEAFATLPASVAAFHLAFGPDAALYVTGPTHGPSEVVYRIPPNGRPAVCAVGFGRPQGLAFDAAGHLYVVDALAGSSGVYRFRATAPDERELVLSGGALIGLAFDPHGGIAVATTDSVYRLAVGIHGFLP